MMTDYSNIPINERLIISLYDYTGVWSKPYADAGYPTLLWDKQVEGCIFKYGLSYFLNLCKGPYTELLDEEERLTQYQLYGIIAAPPCDDFAASGARWWKGKDRSKTPAGDNDEFQNSVELHKACVEIVQQFVEWFNPKFWVLENPRGRMDKCVPGIAPHRQMRFDPCEFGDPYTKETWLYGNFNTDLVKNVVQPLEGSKMHMVSGWDKQEQKRQRSATPQGFAKAFFNANQ